MKSMKDNTLLTIALVLVVVALLVVSLLFFNNIRTIRNSDVPEKQNGILETNAGKVSIEIVSQNDSLNTIDLVDTHDNKE